MANGRMLSKTISIDPEFNGMSSQAQLLYLKAIPHLDRDGLITGHPSKLWAIIDPFHADLLQRMGEYVQEWVDIGLVHRYDTGREQVLFFKGFRKNNANIKYENEAPSQFVPPPGWRRTRAGLVPDDEDLCALLAQKLDPRSTYRQALLEMSPPTNDNVATTSRPSRVSRSRSKEDQDQIAVADQDHTQLVCESGRDYQGKPTRLLQFDDATLQDAALQLGSVLWGNDWRNYADYLATSASENLVVLLEWIWHFTQADHSDYESIGNLPGYVRSCVTKGTRPGLLDQQRLALINEVQHIALQEAMP